MKKAKIRFEIDKIGNKFWTLNNEYHREDGPAIEYMNGHKEWRINGRLHREDGPAIENNEGMKGMNMWYLNGLLHRENGPAMEFDSGTKYWYYYNQKVECKSLEDFQKIIKSMNKNICILDEHENKTWLLDDKLHREDGPAIEYKDGTKAWLLHEKLHRIDGPAIEKNNGDKYWYFNDQLHRLDGPAVEHSNGYKRWYYYGKHVKCYSQKKFSQLIKLTFLW